MTSLDIYYSNANRYLDYGDEKWKTDAKEVLKGIRT